MKEFIYYFYLLALSAEIMVIEIVGAKSLAPFLGSSHYVWMSQIIITLLSLSAGSYLCYLLSDKIKKDDSLEYKALSVPAAYLLFATSLIKEVVFVFFDLPLSFASLLISVALFFVPLAGISFSYSVLVTRKVESTGSGTYGKISSVGTIGNIVGSVLLGYYLVDNLSNQTILIYSSMFLWILSVTPFLLQKKKFFIPYIFPLLFISLEVSQRFNKEPDSLETKTLIEENTQFGELKLIQDGNKMRLLSNNLEQGSFYKDKSSACIFTYALSNLSLQYSKKTDSALIIGSGLGFVLNDLKKSGFKELKGIEINKKVFDVGIKFETIPKEVDIDFADGRYFLSKTNKKYDVIVIDAFVVDNSPSHLNTKEFFQEIRSHLNSDGVVVINSLGYTDPEVILTKSIKKTLDSVFKNSKTFSINDGNVYFVAGDNLSKNNYFKKIPAPIELDKKLDLILSSESELDSKDGIVFYDSINPMDSMNLELREKFRKESVAKTNPNTKK